MTTVAERLQRLIATSGPISVARYMAEANAHYYATRDPLGAGGDFTTAPEISQMFGELVGLCLADLWARAGRPDAAFAELGPGRGTLAADALRAMRAAGLRPPVHLVETSPVLRKIQRDRIGGATTHDHVADLPTDRPLLVVANEFFDALPIRQLVRTGRGWHERMVGHEQGRFVAKAGPPMPPGAIPAALLDAPEGSIIEVSPTLAAVAAELCRRLASAGGAALIVDYGHSRTSAGETLQAVARHAFADPWTDPGERDLTAHVDFEALAAAARSAGVEVHGPVPQGEWLTGMGIELRAESLAGAHPARREEIAAARDRLVSPGQMGTLFKAIALVAPGWPQPAGFA